MSIITLRHAFKALASKDQDSFLNAANEIVDNVQSIGVTQAAELAESLAQSGDTVELPKEWGPFADVPSTGGPASLSTLLCPILIASAGFRVPKLSISGSIAGGIDTMKLIPGFRAEYDRRDFLEFLKQGLIAHAEPGPNICPGDAVLTKARRERNAMADHRLAAASLLSKKLVVPGTAACFDFRVGPVGNIGNNFEEARRSAAFFEKVANELALPVRTVLTDNRSFPCSALGRLESLDLLWNLLTPGYRALKRDDSHLKSCVHLAATACFLADKRRSVGQYETEMFVALENRKARTRFESHVESQGGSIEALVALLGDRKSVSPTVLTAHAPGIWNPPDLISAKEWVKAAQAVDDVFGAVGQVGVRLVRDSLAEVQVGEPLVEVRAPAKIGSDVPDYLRGTIS